ncbi:MAG TPA: hypothetical protein PLJ65_08920, partial [Casimicrobium sp.]|nr:hypothetical protein [Casimicrobium sp.]
MDTATALITVWNRLVSLISRQRSSRVGAFAALAAVCALTGLAAPAQAQTHLGGGAVRTELSHSNRSASTE